MCSGLFCVLYFAPANVDFRSMAIDWNLYNLEEAKRIALNYGEKAVAKMKARLHELDLVDSGELLKSIKATTKQKFGEVDRVQFSYEFYGAIWENGANNVFGKGVTLNPKKWRNDVLEALKPELEAEFGEFYAQLIIQELKIESVSIKM